jgi:nudix-type nucleoside diphosphatase (YffH/AdpP family)
MSLTIQILTNEILSDDWCKLSKVTFSLESKDKEKQMQTREVFDRGNGAAILLYNPKNKSIILTRQFRLPAFLNGSDTGMLIESCAGMLDNDDPEACIKRETEEETGFRVKNVQKIFEAYMSPGAMTEILHFFVAEYDKDMKVSEGGGLEAEQEDIEVLELQFDAAFEMIHSGEIKDAKTIMLLQYAKINHLTESSN